METYNFKNHEVFVEYIKGLDREKNVSIKMVDQKNYKEYHGSFPFTVFSSKLSDVKKMLSRFFSFTPNYSLSVKKENTVLTLYFRVSIEDITMKEFELQLPCTRELTEVEQLRLEVSHLKECAVADLEAKTAEMEEWKQRVDITLKHMAKMERYFLAMNARLRSGCNNYICQNNSFITVSLPNSTGAQQAFSLDSERLSLNGATALNVEPFYNLKRLECSATTNLTGVCNEFVEELVLSKCPGLKDLKGIEGMPNLKTISFDECPLLNPSHLFDIEHQITEIYARACPNILELKDDLKTHGISYKPFV